MDNHVKHVAHHHQSDVWHPVGFDRVEAVEQCDLSVLVLHHMLVIIRQDPSGEQHSIKGTPSSLLL